MSRVVFLLSPAHCGARRAQILLREQASFELALRIREMGAPLGEVFSFLSGLYFRGKLAYARTFARGAEPQSVSIITPGLGLRPADHLVTRDDLLAIAAIGVTPDEPRFRDPLAADTRALAETLDGDDRVVLLGSIATGKYVDVLIEILGDRLRFPSAFVGRGDMSRGGLMLRCVRDLNELEYIPVAGAVRHGARPPKLEPIR